MSCQHEKSCLSVIERYSEQLQVVVCEQPVQLMRHMTIFRCQMCGSRVVKSETLGKDIVNQIEKEYYASQR